ncbi:MAG TPA: hypothetical protein V6D14_29025 [Coleofasciculaceae cyanobacterium]
MSGIRAIAFSSNQTRSDRDFLVPDEQCRVSRLAEIPQDITYLIRRN